MKKELLEKVEAFQNLLISYATGGQVTEAEFTLLREELINEPILNNRLPRFVRTVRDFHQFWSFIKGKSPTYGGRREYLWGQFKPILEELEEKSGSPSDSRVTQTIAEFNADAVHSSWRDALQRRIDDPDGAITSARTLIESVCKHILDEASIPYDDKSDLPRLYRLTSEALNLAPSQQAESILRQVTGGCSAVVEGIGAMRNALGDAHGKGKSSAKPQLRHAKLAVNLAGALAVFLIETWGETNARAI